MYPFSIYFGPEVPMEGVLSCQSIYYLGTWTLRALGADTDRKCKTADQPFKSQTPKHVEGRAT